MDKHIITLIVRELSIPLLTKKIFFLFSPFLLFYSACRNKTTGSALPVSSVSYENPAYTYLPDKKFVFETRRIKDGRLLWKDTITLQVFAEKLSNAPSQDKITWAYSDQVSVVTGMIQNDTMVWMHPPREGRYKLTELIPFPSIKLPIQTGKQWDYQLNVGEHYSDSTSLEWKGDLHFDQAYEIEGAKAFSSKFGLIDCTVVKATGVCKYGKTQLYSLYNNWYGFVYLEGILLNGSSIEIELLDVLDTKWSQNASAPSL
ncbi:hypothetical protein QNI16_32915 [Cytophagaceae bacterium YF14B1]|uniref:Uncharacterized protein n=1 Tax=Xanthocytophaga flava TaxID=3048013 RepID=A0AAE3QTU1_9BACT|nr:hypothetical protein [Xanthocytophaga flavus]MDJ1485340.1 hypothetical protein [Xanthocytophaga flavus]